LIVKRNSTGSAGYSIVGSAVSGANLSDLAADYLYAYDESDGSWDTPSGSMDTGKGYFVGYDASAPQISLTGSLVSGNQSVALAKTGEGFNLVANPYAAAISISSLLNNANNLNSTTGTVYLWDDGGQNVGNDRGGDYITVNDLGSVGANDQGDGVSGVNGSGAAINGNIGSLQGFFVKAATASNLDFKPSMQVSIAGSNADENFYRKAQMNKSIIRLSISGNELYNETLIGLVSNASDQVDFALDAHKFSDESALSFYSFIEDEKFAIQAIPLLETQPKEIQLGFDAKRSGAYEISVGQFDGFNDSQIATLIDNQTGEKHLLAQGTTLQFTSEVVIASQRFSLLLSPAAVLSALDTDNNIKISGTENNLSILFSSDKLEDVVIYSMDGRVLFSNTVQFTKDKALIRPSSLLRNQVYVLRVSNKSLKFLIK